MFLKFPKKNKHIIRILTSFPIVMLGYFIFQYGIHIPHWDDWRLIVEPVELFYKGNSLIGEILTPYNGYIMPIPKLLYILIGVIGHLDMFYFHVLSYIFLILSLAIIFKVFNHIPNSCANFLFFIPFSFIVFSLSQWENFIYGVTICGYLSLLFQLIGLFFLYKFEKSQFEYLYAILAGLISSFSYISGLVIWPLGMIILTVHHGIKNKFTYIWMIISMSVLLTYYYFGILTLTGGLLSKNLNEPLNYVYYYIANIGGYFIPMESPLANYFTFVLLFGIFTLFLAIVLIFLSFIQHRIKNDIFWICLIFNSLLVTILTTIGRAQYGIIQAISPRYAILTIPLIVGIYGLLVTNYFTKIKFIFQNRILLFLFLIIVFLGFINSAVGAHESLQQRHEYELSTFTNSLINYKSLSNEELKGVILPNTDYLRKRLDFMSNYQIYPFSRH